MPSIFTRIVQGEIPCYKIAEDDKYFAFLDINPMGEGHTLVIPKREEDYIFDLDENELAGMMVFAQKIAKALHKAVACKRVAIMVLGLEVPHAHIHLIPINSEKDVDFRKTKLKFTAEEFTTIAEKINKEVDKQ